MHPKLIRSSHVPRDGGNVRLDADTATPGTSPFPTCIVSDVDNGYFLEFFQIWALQTGCRYAACVFYDAGMTLAVSAVALV